MCQTNGGASEANNDASEMINGASEANNDAAWLGWVVLPLSEAWASPPGRQIESKGREERVKID